MSPNNKEKEFGRTLISAINNAQEICVAGHVNPDGDAIGACLSVALAIKSMGKTPVVLLEKIPEKFNFLQGREYLFKYDYNTLSCDLFIALDTSTKERLGEAEVVFERSKETYCIDHHVSNPKYAQHNFVANDSPATCEVVYNILCPFIEINKAISEAIYTGILCDTGGFRHNSTSPETHCIVSKLVSHGIDFPMIQREILYAHSIRETKTFQVALNNLCLLTEMPVAYSWITLDELAQCGAEVSDLDGIVEYLLNIRGVEISVFFSERGKNIIKASFRSLTLNVNKIASQFGGGGHKNAAGATLNGDIKKAIGKVLFAIEKEMNNGQ